MATATISTGPATKDAQAGRGRSSPSSSQRMAYATRTGPAGKPDSTTPRVTAIDASRENDASRAARDRIGASCARVRSTSRANG